MPGTRGYHVGPMNAVKRSFPVLSTSTFKEGDLLTVDSSGRLQQLIAVSTVYTTQIFIGMANENALNDQGVVKTAASVTLWLPDVIFALPLYSATPTNAVWNSNLIATANIFGLRNDANGFPQINLDDTSNTQVRIIGLLGDEGNPGWPTTVGAGTIQYPLVLCTPLKANCLLSGNR